VAPENRSGGRPAAVGDRRQDAAADGVLGELGALEDDVDDDDEDDEEAGESDLAAELLVDSLADPFDEPLAEPALLSVR
jgi:hypothetical protein